MRSRKELGFGNLQKQQRPIQNGMAENQTIVAAVRTVCATGLGMGTGTISAVMPLYQQCVNWSFPVEKFLSNIITIHDKLEA